MAVSVIAVVALGLHGPLAAAASNPMASGADLQLVQASLGSQRAEDLAEQWLAAEQSAEKGQCAASVGNGYCDKAFMKYGRGGSCTGDFCQGIATLQQCCDVLAAMPDCKSAPHVGFIPADGPGVTGACGCCSAFRANEEYMAEFYSAAEETRAAEESHTGGGKAVGDPHLQNIYGQQFDLMQPGRHTLIRIPGGASATNTKVSASQLLLDVSAKVRQVGARCSDMYFRELNITGAWAESKQAGGFLFRAEGAACDGESWKMSLGKLDLKVVRGCTSNSARYLNFYVKHLGRVELTVGGLLGEDDHTAEATPSKRCSRAMTLLQYDDAVEGGPLGPNGPTKRH